MHKGHALHRQSSTEGPRRRWFLLLSLFAMVCVLLVASVLWQLVALSSLAATAERVSQAQPLLSLLRITGIAMVIAFWPRSPVQLEQLRWRVAAWLITLELLLGQNLPLKLIRAGEALLR